MYRVACTILCVCLVIVCMEEDAVMIDQYTSVFLLLTRASYVVLTLFMYCYTYWIQELNGWYDNFEFDKNGH